AAIPRPSGPWQAMQRVLKVAPATARIFSACATVLPVVTGSADGIAAAGLPAVVIRWSCVTLDSAGGGVGPGTGCGGLGRGPAIGTFPEFPGGPGCGSGAGGSPGTGRRSEE